VDLLDDLEVLERPLGDHRLDEHRGVGEALVVEHGVQRAEADLDLAAIDSLKSRIGTP
jgi:hypothetical protein